MTTYATSAVSESPLPLNWRYVSALSSTFVLHIGALLLLALPVALPILRPPTADPKPIWVEISSPKPVELPVPELQPPVKPPVHRNATPKPTLQPSPINAFSQAIDNAEIIAVESTITEPTQPSAPVEAAPSELAYASVTTPRYPPEALRRHEQGTVMLRVLVNLDGQPGRIEIEHSSGSPRLDQAAREAVAHWRFKPVVRKGVAIQAWGIVPVKFSLDRE